jgi:hypothetical protein
VRATWLAHDVRLEHQLIKTCLPDQKVLHLNIAQALFKATGLYDGTLHNFDARLAVDKTFTNSCLLS